jgi:hypothetical protein
MLSKPIVIALVIALSACGFAMQGPPPGHQQMKEFKCSESIAGPLGDLLVGTVVAFIGLLIAEPLFDDGSGGSGAGYALAVASGLGYGTSAIVGIGKAVSCGTAKRSLAARVAVDAALANVAAPTEAPARPAPQTPTIVSAPTARADTTTLVALPAQPIVAAPTARTDTAASGTPPRPQTFSIGIAGSKDTIMVGTRLQLLASARTLSGADIPNLRYRWTSSDGATATVGPAGRVTALLPGVVTITAQFGAVAGSVTVVIVRR